ncbi:alpha-2-macroglobulin [Ornithobacterium rhinotracheale]|uniref:Large extracellular alpha-helical protein n=2 Tax=Ornithobacterium rhinotracheale TaxID=28251 RepID=I3ZYR6_ORNRL|nr:alpha-2-macroglobulin family protein [Ornithobacterium rhinotracheale]AFL96850.1 large extracellular alpha-helical protein [Ornithobacterium rhinotracheale DSM 15997]AIQ00536.1 hypothetical protein Q785_06465 [Ornithobacterium rhinotracheale ORT-UMN 88]KGB66643.1 hypothetical protein Q787_06280 [Ornithobacterium rhinotracheale H06-030791]MCK0194918.1 MG2 domain-containing protein [Ornithobacterium rhinotracheale]UOH64235.1 MG2 domain-containing protein [Ornithobacterium rhinotracheale]
MKKWLFLTLLIFISWNLNAQNKNLMQDWNQIEKKVENGDYKSLVPALEAIYQKAEKNNDLPSKIKALLIKANVETSVSDKVDNKLDIVNLFKSEIQKSKGTERAIWQAYLAKLYNTYYIPSMSKNFSTSQRSEDFREWTQQQKIEAIKELLNEATANPALLDQPLKDYKLLVEGDLQKNILIKTLYDLVLYEAYEIMDNFSQESEAANQYLIKLRDYQKQQKSPNWLYYEIAILKEQWNDEQVSKEKYLAELKELYTQNSNNPWSGMALLQWVEQNEEASPAIYELVIAKIEQFKDFAYTPYLEILAQKLVAPEIQIKSLTSWSPNTNSPIEISHKNTGNKIYYRLYERTLNKRLRYRLGEYSSVEIEGFKNFKIAAKGEITLKKFDDLKTHKTVFPLAFPKGNYYLLFSSRPDFNEKSALSGSEITVRDWNNDKLLLTDKNTNAPLKKAKATILVYDQELGKIIKKTPVVTDENGVIPFSLTSRRYYLEYYLEKDGVFVNFYPEAKKTKEDNFEHTSAKILTDRNLYRPGQEVFVKAIVYDDVNMRPKTNLNYTILLKNAKYETIASKEIKTNSFGSSTTSFILPTNDMPGNYQLMIKDLGQTGIRVEEYKRPNFEVKLNPYEGQATLNQTVNITGNVMSYAGANIPNATVEYNVRRIELEPYRFFFSNRKEVQIKSGKTATNAQGNFEISFDATSNAPASQAKYFSYDVRVKVTDPSGETHSANKRYSFSNVPFYITTETQGSKLSSNFKEIDIKTFNVNNQPVSEKVKVELFAYEPNDRILIPFKNNSDYEILSKSEFIKELPHVAYMGDSLKVKNLVFAEEYTTQENTKFQLPQQLAAGHYKLIISQNANGAEIKTERNIVVLDDQSLKINENAFFVMQFDQSKQFNPGEKAIVYFGGAAKGGHVKIEIYGKNNTLIKREFVPVYGKLIRYEIPIKEEYRGNISLSLSYEKFNYTQSENFTILVPFNNKKLEITTETFRSLLEPGKGEKWKFKVLRKNGKTAESEVLATMYDASLNAIYRKNNINFFPYRSNYNYHTAYNNILKFFSTIPETEDIKFKEYNFPLSLNLFGLNLSSTNYDIVVGFGRQKRAAFTGSLEGVAKAVDLSALKSALKEERVVIGNNPRNFKDNEPKENLSIRKNLNETAFFYPDLKTDANGDFWVEFTAPESLTTWNFQALAQTKDFSFGYLNESVKTQKELMVTPNMPRFLRVGDEIYLKTRVDNLSDQAIEAQVSLNLINPNNNQSLDKNFKLKNKSQSVNIPAHGTQVVTWKIEIPSNLDVVLFRVFAKGKKHQDGVENMLPILSNQVLVTETMPVYVNKGQSKRFVMPNIEENSKTRNNISMKFEFTKNPSWFAVLALPYLDNPDFKTTDNILNGFISNAMSYQIMKDNPKFENYWKSYREQNKFESPLNQNSEYKNLALQATPWTVEAKDEKERMYQLSNYFNKNQAELNINRYLSQLGEMQLRNGAFPWFKDGLPNLYESVYVLQNLGEFLNDHPEYKNSTKRIIGNLISYLDSKIIADWQEVKNPFEKQFLIDRVTRFLYGRSFFVKDYPLNAKLRKINDFVLKESFNHLNNYTIRGKGVLALTLNNYNRKAEAQKVMHFIKERATISEEMGMYWNEKFSSWFYSDIERQALLIRAFEKVSNDQESVDLMKIWLLKNKETNQWDNNKNTAAAVNALLNVGGNLMNESTEVTIKIGGKNWQPTKGDEIGGVYNETWQPNQIKPSLGEIELKKETPGTAWGALYYQYLENMDKVKSTETGLSVKKEMYKRSNMNDHEKLIPINEKTPLNIGDIVLVRLKIQADRDMEFVHLKDMRAAGLEPVQQISGYRWVSGLAYYQSTKDIATHFFIDRLGKGFHIIEYELLVNNAGDFSNGYSEIQSFYAPGFLSRTAGERIQVED